jgi:hypothetical protein
MYTVAGVRQKNLYEAGHNDAQNDPHEAAAEGQSSNNHHKK